MKFSIRDLLLVIVIVALALGWWIHARTNATKIRELENMIRDYEHHGVTLLPKKSAGMAPQQRQSLRGVTPVMASGLVDDVWTLSMLLSAIARA
jgi:hypothetical protein